MVIHRLKHKNLLILVLFVAAIAVFWSKPVSAATFTVTNTNNSGSGSLRQAIIDANAASNLDTINFNIPGGPYQTISVNSTLQITQPVIIDGTSQPGFSGSSVIEINGAGVGAGTSGVHVTGGGTTIKGMIVNRFGGDGIIYYVSSGQITAHTQLWCLSGYGRQPEQYCTGE